MQKKNITFQIKGMRRDLSVSKADPNYAYEIINMRLTPIEGETALSLVNEKGNSSILLTEDGINQASLPTCEYVGHCVINQYLVLFIKRVYDGHPLSTIYCIDFSDISTINGQTHYKLTKIFDTHQYNNTLNFDPAYPIETIGDYETEDIIKVYFTDGREQPKVINIKKQYYHAPPAEISYNSDELNFIRTLKTDQPATVTITKQESAGALFSAGTIQYIFTYYTKNAQESNIFYTSPLYYINPGTRGGSPEETVGNSFTIQITNPDSDFDYVRIYSLRRTSLDATPIAKRVVDLPIISSSSPIAFTDINISGEEIDPTILYYVGGEPISAGTFEAKDNTLFLGDISLLRRLPGFSSVKENPFKSYGDSSSATSTWDYGTKTISVNSGIDPSVGGFTYNYESSLGGNSSSITVFKAGETYRLGFQLQHKSGVWSDVYWLKDTIIQNTNPGSGVVNTTFRTLTFSDNGSLVQSISTLKALGYNAIRPMIVYPKMSDRTVLCQGMVCPTVYNLKDRYDNNIYAQASWFARPIPYSSSLSYTDNSNYTTNGAWVEFRHNHMLHPSGAYSNEIQSMDAGSTTNILHNSNPSNGIVPFKNGSINQGYDEKYSDYYFVDNSVITINTPELDFDSSFILDSDSSYTFKIVGAIPINSTTSDINILASAPFEGDTCTTVYGGTSQNTQYGDIKLGAINRRFSMTGVNGWKHSSTYPQWVARRVFDLQDEESGSNNDNYKYIIAGVFVSPWQKTGQFVPVQKKMLVMSKHLEYLEPQYTSDTLKQKRLSHLLFSYNSYYLTSPWELGTPIPITTFNSDEVVSKRIKVPEYSFGRYYGNIDKVLASGTDNGGLYNVKITHNYYEFDTQQSFPEGNYYNMTIEHLPSVTSSLDASYDCMLNNSLQANKDEFKSSDPIHIKYKSTPHLVLSLTTSQNGVNDPSKNVIPHMTDKVNTYGGESNHIRNLSNVSVNAPYGFDNPNLNTGGYIWLGEICNPNVQNRFGGDTEDALIANDWVVGGNTVPLNDNFTITWDRGDTYYQRYDCLKTYPFTLEDENSIVEVVSFMCETRVNIDGRYDRNRGTASLVAHPTNYNLYNPVYSQRDNFFTYHGFNSKNNVVSFPNQITWTLTKHPNAEIDKWTNITLASTLNLDGDRGGIKKIEKLRNDLFAFQDKGISRILFNDRTVLSTNTGLPVELVNSGRVEGKQYMTELEGLTNKQSIKVTPNGIYFVDGKTKSAYLFNGQQCVSLSDTKAMKVFFDNEPDNFKIFYDSKEKDVYFVNNSYCLCFSEKLGEFAGFFRYENTPMMDNVMDKFLSMYNSTLWEQYAGDYNTIYNTIYPHSITFVGNDNLPFDKFYTNLEFLSDSFLNGTYVTTKTFDHLKVWNEYQTGESSLVNTLGMPSNLKKKFRIWRAQIPRANWNGRDRMRNPWCFVQLRMDNPSTYKTVLHQTSLEYYV